MLVFVQCPRDDLRDLIRCDVQLLQVPARHQIFVDGPHGVLQLRDRCLVTGVEIHDLLSPSSAHLFYKLVDQRSDPDGFLRLVPGLQPVDEHLNSVIAVQHHGIELLALVERIALQLLEEFDALS